MKDVLIISDTQAPYHHVDTLAFLSGVKDHYGFHEDNEEDEFVHIGDEMDSHAIQVGKDRISDPDLPGPGDEWDAGIRFMRQLYELFPRAKACVSNHTMRPWLKAVRAGIPRRFMVSVREAMEAPDSWIWADSWRIEAAQGSTDLERMVNFEHGMGFSGKNGALTAAQARNMKTVIGHLHGWAAIAYWSTSDYLIWGMNVGSLIDKDSLAYAYGKFYRTRPIISTGVIVDGVPHLVPMQLKKSGRWNGRL